MHSKRVGAPFSPDSERLAGALLCGSLPASWAVSRAFARYVARLRVSRYGGVMEAGVEYSYEEDPLRLYGEHMPEPDGRRNI